MFESTNPSAPARQKIYLKHFFDDLLQHKAIMCYELTEKLLKVTDIKELEAAYETEKQKKPPNGLRDIYHFNGSVIC